ncbi:MAG: hypothetical protein AAB113_00645 [Candidatus Eisenbacteria bacterium]|jgi:predicted RNA-binding Zn-ribbon protein involved in translation (DUF1610 family)
MEGAFKCPNCGATTWGALKCCPKCGEALTRRCPDCGVTWRYIYDGDYQYCPACGARAASPR